jgi:hypothetical protein
MDKEGLIHRRRNGGVGHGVGDNNIEEGDNNIEARARSFTRSGIARSAAESMFMHLQPQESRQVFYNCKSVVNNSFVAAWPLRQCSFRLTVAVVGSSSSNTVPGYQHFTGTGTSTS